jgi:hypothetical protein
MTSGQDEGDKHTRNHSRGADSSKLSIIKQSVCNGPGAATRESLRRDRPGGLASPASHACGSACLFRACCCHNCPKQVVSSSPYKQVGSSSLDHGRQSKHGYRIKCAQNPRKPGADSAGRRSGLRAKRPDRAVSALQSQLKHAHILLSTFRSFSTPRRSLHPRTRQHVPHDVIVTEAFHHLHLALHVCQLLRGHLRFVDLLHRHQLARVLVQAKVHRSKSTLTKHRTKLPSAR